MVTVYQKIKRQQILIIVFLVVVLITVSIWYLGGKKTQFVPPVQPVETPFKKVEINFQVLENPLLKELEFYEKIGPIKPEEVGRENPFLPWK
jgi:hypothetical protein